MRVLRGGPHELAVGQRVVALGDALGALERAPAEVLRRLVGLEQDAVDLLDVVLPDVADPDLAERGVEREAPRVAQADQLDAPARPALDARGQQLAQPVVGSWARRSGSNAPPPSPMPT